LRREISRGNWIYWRLSMQQHPITGIAQSEILGKTTFNSSSSSSPLPKTINTRLPVSNVLFICKTKSRLRQRHCGLARHFKTDPTETVALCFGYAKTLQLTMKALGLAHHFKTDPTNTVALCFGYEKTLQL
jgi:hypothetical protein